MAEERKSINYESDFKAIITLKGAWCIGVPFRLTFYTNGNTTYVASWDGHDEFINCRFGNESGTLVVVGFDQHGLEPGKLKVRKEFWKADSDMHQDDTANYVSVENCYDESDANDPRIVYLTKKQTDEDDITFSSVYVVGAMRGEPGKAFTWDDLTEEQKEALRGKEGHMSPEQLEELHGKVDSEEGKSLIDEDVAEHLRHVEAEEAPQGRSAAEPAPAHIESDTEIWAEDVRTKSGVKLSDAVSKFIIGPMSNLLTKAKGSIVEAINELFTTKQDKLKGVNEDGQVESIGNNDFAVEWNEKLGRYEVIAYIPLIGKFGIFNGNNVEYLTKEDIDQKYPNLSRLKQSSLELMTAESSFHNATIQSRLIPYQILANGSIKSANAIVLKGTFTNDVILRGIFKPVEANDAANKAYVDEVADRLSAESPKPESIRESNGTTLRGHLPLAEVYYDEIPVRHAVDVAYGYFPDTAEYAMVICNKFHEGIQTYISYYPTFDSSGKIYGWNKGQQYTEDNIPDRLKAIVHPWSGKASCTSVIDDKGNPYPNIPFADVYTYGHKLQVSSAFMTDEAGKGTLVLCANIHNDLEKDPIYVYEETTAGWHLINAFEEGEAPTKEIELVIHPWAGKVDKEEGKELIDSRIAGMIGFDIHTSGNPVPGGLPAREEILVVRGAVQAVTFRDKDGHNILENMGLGGYEVEENFIEDGIIYIGSGEYDYETDTVTIEGENASYDPETNTITING